MWQRVTTSKYGVENVYNYSHALIVSNKYFNSRKVCVYVYVHMCVSGCVFVCVCV